MNERSKPNRFASFVLPPDFYPEREVDVTTWIEAVVEPVTLIGAAVCFALGLIQLGQALAPDWPTRFLPPLAILVGIEAFFYSRRLARGTVMFKEWLVLLVPVIVLVRFLPYLDDPAAAPSSASPSWPTASFSSSSGHPSLAPSSCSTPCGFSRARSSRKRIGSGSSCTRIISGQSITWPRCSGWASSSSGVALPSSSSPPWPPSAVSRALASA